LIATGSEEGWVSLFDGKTLSGWTTADGTAGQWKVEDGAITCSGPASHLFSPRGDYKNLRYRVELKINDKGNSGMYFRTKKGPGFPQGYEAQVNSTHRDPIKTGSIYTFVHVFKELVPPDTFFTQEIEAVDREYRGKLVTAIKVWVNNELLYEFLDHDHTFTEGHFAFQHHDPGGKVAIRKIEVKELTEAQGKQGAGTKKVEPRERRRRER
jgi:hypothetical protein